MRMACQLLKKATLGWGPDPGQQSSTHLAVVAVDGRGLDVVWTWFIAQSLSAGGL